MRTRTASLLAAAAMLVAAPIASAPAASSHHGGAPVVAAKHCPPGYPKARTPDGKVKCLHAGEFCKRKHSWQRVYHRHGFHCKRDHRLRER
jgi:hypothetical protein